MPTADTMAVCRYLDWDSEFFGQRIARLTAARLTAGNLPAIDAWCRTEKIDCLYFLADSGDEETIRLAEDHGFRLVDIRVTMALKMSAWIADAGGAAGDSIRAFEPADLPVLKEMAGRLHRDSRFFSDSGFPESRSRKLFEKWLENSCLRPTDRVFVAEDAGKAAGYITCHPVSPEAGQIELVAVDVPAQARGLGRALMRAALAWFAAGGMAEVTIVTQGRNVRALRLYERCGFQIRSLQLWYHRRPGAGRGG
jgi:dTDP-4-amino-4,6-dideoxy-D-galactose acyltransferase